MGAIVMVALVALLVIAAAITRVLSLPPPTGTPEAAAEHVTSNLATQRGIWRATNVIVYLVLAEGVIGLIGIALIYSTLMDTRRTLKRSREQTHLAYESERAHIIVEFSAKFVPAAGMHRHQRIRAVPVVINIGRSYALNVECHFASDPRGIPRREPWEGGFRINDSSDRGLIPDARSYSGRTAYLTPGSLYETPAISEASRLESNSLSHLHYKDDGGIASEFYCTAHISYLDAFGFKHWTVFFALFRPDRLSGSMIDELGDMDDGEILETIDTINFEVLHMGCGSEPHWSREISHNLVDT